MFHSCGDFDLPVISVCGTEILMEKFDIQKLVVYATDLDEKNTSRTGFWPFRTRDGQIEDWNKKNEPSPLCSLFRWKGRWTPSCTSAIGTGVVTGMFIRMGMGTGMSTGMGMENPLSQVE